MIFDFLPLLLLLLFSFRIDQAHSADKIKCRGIPIDQMTPFNYQSEQWKEDKQIMIEIPNISDEELTIKRTYIGYIDKNGKGMEKQCVLIKIYGEELKDFDEEERKRYENSVKVSKMLKEIDPANEHFVKLIDYGTVDKSIREWAKSVKWVTISELGERELKDEFKKVGELSTEEIKTMSKDIMKPLVKFHKVGIHLRFAPWNLIVFESKANSFKLTDFEAPVLYLDGQKKGIVKENFDNPFDFIAPELLENYSYGGQGDVEVTPKMDIWSAGLIILQFALKKTFGYKEMDEKIWQLFRSAKLNLPEQKLESPYAIKYNQPEKKLIYLAIKLNLPEQIYQSNDYKEYDKYWPSQSWWEMYLTVITDILTVWDKMPEIVFLSVNMLNIDAQKRMSAQGVIDYLEGKCKPKEYEKNTKKIALFGDVSAEKLEKFMGKNHMGFSVFRKYLNDDGRIKNKDALEKLENIKQNLIKNALISIETFLKELDKRAEFCDH